MALVKDYVYFSPACDGSCSLPGTATSLGFALYNYRKDGSKVLLVDCYGSPFVLWPEPALLESFLRNEASVEDIVRNVRASTLTMRGLSLMQKIRLHYWVLRMKSYTRSLRRKTVFG